MTQEEALKILKMGHNVFITGPAGSGKTHLLNRYIKYLRENNVDVGITASTGIDGTHMGGMTIHAWSGIGIRDKITEYDLDDLDSRSYLRKRLGSAKVLIIDEISMLHHFRLDMVEKVMRTLRRNEDFFGGLQVIFCGDYFQLPPVSRTGEAPSRFAYHSNIWRKMDLKVCYLEEQFRQSDLAFLEILNAIRDNNISEKVKEHLKSRFNKKPNLEAEPTKLYSHNIDVDFENERELAKIKGQTFEYKMMTEGRGKIVENLKKGCLAPEILRLKKGARVMFVKNNFEKGYANGTLGIVSDLSEYSIKVRTARGKVVEVERAKWIVEDGGKILAELDQYPLRLAWAITVHKSQGMSLDSAEIDLSQSFERGMGYVALSRVRSLDGLSLLGMNDMALKVSEEVLEFDKEFRAISERHRKELAMMENKEIAEAEKNFLAKVSGAKEEKKKKKNTVEETGKLFLAGKSLKEIVELRNITLGTVITHLEKIKEQNPYFNFSGIRDEMSAGKLNKIRSAFSKVGMSEGGYLLSPIKNALGPSVTFEEIRLVRLLL
jgi:ATP-dependent exoDNAse (exonuclease V) alpha subunit